MAVDDQIPPAAWFHDLAELTGDVYLVVRVSGEPTVEYYTGDAPDLLAEGGPLDMWHTADGVSAREIIFAMRPGDVRHLDLRHADGEQTTTWIEAAVRCRTRDEGDAVVEASFAMSRTAGGRRRLWPSPSAGTACWRRTPGTWSGP